MTHKRDKDYEWYNDEYWLEAGVDLVNRRVMLDVSVDEISVGLILRAIEKMESTTTSKPIRVYINTYGGSCYDGLALYDRLRRCQSDVYTIATGKVMSMGTWIMLAGDYKYAERNASFMWHSIAGGVHGEGKLFEQNIDVEESKRLWDILMEIYAERSLEQKKSWWKRWLKFEDKYGGVDKAMELGFVDEVLEHE